MLLLREYIHESCTRQFTTHSDKKKRERHAGIEPATFGLKVRRSNQTKLVARFADTMHACDLIHANRTNYAICTNYDVCTNYAMCTC